MLHFLKFGSGFAERAHDAVGAEVALMGAGEVIAGVETFDIAGSDFLRMIDGLVGPVPDTAADGAFRRFDDIPIFLEVTDCLTHCVGILAKEVGAGFGAVVVGGEGRQAGIHFRGHVGVAPGVAVDAFVVDDARVERTDSVVAILEVDVVGTFVAHRPEDNAGVVAVAEHHAFLAVNEGRTPRSVGAERSVGMTFNVGFVHDVDAEMVEHGIHLGLIGIVAGAQGVDVVLLEHGHILEHSLHVDGATQQRMRVVAVGAFEEHLAAVDVNELIDDFNVAEAIFCGECLGLVAVGIFEPHHHGVERRRLSRPEAQAREVGREVKGRCRAGSQRVEALGGEGIFHLSRGIEQLDMGRNRAGDGRTVVNFELNVELAGSIAGGGVEFARNIMIAHEGLGHGGQRHVAVDTAHAPHILVFEIGPVAPAEHLHGKSVDTLTGSLGDVKFMVGVGSLCVADKLTVHPNIGGRIDAFKVEKQLMAVPRRGHVELGDVRPHGVHTIVGIGAMALNVRRILGKGIVNIDIERHVIAFHFPVGGHGDAVPT